jgi:hypothetical protein
MIKKTKVEILIKYRCPRSYLGFRCDKFSSEFGQFRFQHAQMAGCCLVFLGPKTMLLDKKIIARKSKAS